MANKNFIVKNGLDVSGSANLSTLNLTGSLTGPASFTIDPAAVGDNTGTVIIAGNLQVDGTQTTINSATMTVDDLNLTLASGAANAAAANGAGITVDGASATLLYASSGDKFVFNKALDVTGAVKAYGNSDTVAALELYSNSNHGMRILHRATEGDFSFERRVGGTNTEFLRIGRANGNATFAGSITLSSNSTSVNTRSLLARDTNGLNIGTTNATTAISIDNSAHVSMPYNLSVTGLIKTTNTVEIASAQPRLHLNRGNGSYSWNIYNGNGSGNFPNSTFNIANNAGTAVITALDNGNVGIGTTAPAHKLHVQNASGTTFVRTEVAAGSLVGFNIKKTGSTTQEWNIVDGATVNGRLQIQDVTDNRVDMTFDGTGKVGIGDTSPQDFLEVRGTALGGITISNPNHNQAALSFARSSTATARIFTSEPGATHTADLRFQTSNASGSSPNLITAMTIDENQLVGIGTTAPNAPLSLIRPSLTTLSTGEGGLRVHRPNAASQYGYFDYGYNGGGINLGSLYTGGGSGSFGTFTFRQHSSTTSQVPMFINNIAKVGIGTTSIDNNAKLHIEDSGYPIINLDRSSSLTTGNHLGYINFQNNGDVYGYMGAWVESASGTDGKLVFATQNGTSLTDKMTINSTGHLTLNPASGFSGLNNSLLGSTNGYMYAMGGSAGLYLGDNSDLSNAIGIRNANYIDFTTGGVTTHKFDTGGIHFQRADGQSITAKESLIMTVDADNNTASRVFQVNHGNGKTLLVLYDDYRTDVGTIQYSSTRSAGYGSAGGFSAAADDWVDVAAVPYGRNIATIKFFWDGVSAPSSAHHGNMEFDIQSHYGTSYYYGWDSSITLKNSSAHNSFYIKEARIITPNGSGATGYFQVKFGVACSTGTFRCYVTSRDENCSIDPVNPAVNNSRSGTTIAEVLLDNRPSIATSRDVTVTGLVRAQGQPAFRATGNQGWSTLSSGVQVPFNIAVVNTGGDYSASNKRFTAPVTGNYFLAWHTYNDNGYNNAIVPRVNGTALTGGGGDDIVAYSASGLTGNLTVSASIVQSLAKGDLVDMACRGGHNSRIYMPHSQFSGFLIG